MQIFLEYLPSIINLTLLQVIGLISPGPDFAIVVRNSLIYSRRTALLTAFGIAVGIQVHVTYTLLGLGLVISKTAWLATCLKYIGASYLLYIGYKGVCAKKRKLQFGNKQQLKDISPLTAFGIGFATNVLNPKSMLFFISLLSTLVAPHAPTMIMATYAIIIFTTTLLWFSFVALCLTSDHTRNLFGSMTHWIERVTGGLLMLLGLKLLL
jgi:RhtB (resistance to homoserine/threonine) family protein